MFGNIQMINGVLSELESFVRERNDGLTGALRDADMLKRIG
jgi:hypothetical protein